MVAFTVADRILVLDGGRVAYLGGTYPLHERPSDAFVARFVGFENVFARGELAARQDEAFPRWLLERSGPAGVAFRASSVTVAGDPFSRVSWTSAARTLTRPVYAFYPPLLKMAIDI